MTFFLGWIVSVVYEGPSATAQMMLKHRAFRCPYPFSAHQPRIRPTTATAPADTLLRSVRGGQRTQHVLRRGLSGSGRSTLSAFCDPRPAVGTFDAQVSSRPSSTATSAGSERPWPAVLPRIRSRWRAFCVAVSGAASASAAAVGNAPTGAGDARRPHLSHRRSPPCSEANPPISRKR